MRMGSITTDIISDGLVFNMDAANRACYTGVGSTTTNTLSSAQSGSIISSPTFTTEHGGGWVMDGVDDSILCNFDNFSGHTKFTFSLWFKGNSSDTGRQHIFSYSKANTGTSGADMITFDLNDGGAEIWIYWEGGGVPRWFKNDMSSLNDDTVHNLVFTTDTGNHACYLDGSVLSPSLVSTGTNVELGPSTPATCFVVLGSVPHGYSYGGPWTGTFYNAHIYGRALSAAEVLHNYNALKSRFGL